MVPCLLPSCSCLPPVACCLLPNTSGMWPSAYPPPLSPQPPAPRPQPPAPRPQPPAATHPTPFHRPPPSHPKTNSDSGSSDERNEPNKKKKHESGYRQSMQKTTYIQIRVFYESGYKRIFAYKRLYPDSGFLAKINSKLRENKFQTT